MRTRLADYEMARPSSLADALRMMAGDPGRWHPFAGGTDLMVLMEAGRLPGSHYLNIWNLEELRGIDAAPAQVTIGALATYTDLLEHPVIQQEFPLLCAAARETGAVAIQNRGTVGGNIANASPAADLPPALLVYDATLRMASVRGERTVPYDRFHTGYKKMDLAPDELIVSVSLPRGRAHWHQAYRKVGTRRAQAISKTCFAAAVELDKDGVVNQARVAFGSVAPTVVRCRAAERALQASPLDDDSIGRARAAVTSEIAPIDDIRSSAKYRRRVSANLLEQFLRGVRV